MLSSGALADGRGRLGCQSRPSAVHELQAAAAVGQNGLTQCYEQHFARHGMLTAQILLTHDDLSNRKRYLNALSALRTLVEMRVVPVINENDTVVTDEIRFGDNDTLGALVANLLEADALLLLTDQEGLFDADPRSSNLRRALYFDQSSWLPDDVLERAARMTMAASLEARRATFTSEHSTSPSSSRIRA